MISHSQSKRSLAITQIAPSFSICAFMVRVTWTDAKVLKMTATKDFKLLGYTVNTRTGGIIKAAYIPAREGATFYFTASDEEHLAGYYYVNVVSGCGHVSCTCVGHRFNHKCHHQPMVTDFIAMPRIRPPKRAPEVEPVQPAAIEPAPTPTRVCEDWDQPGCVGPVPVETPEERDRQIAYWREVMKRDRERQKAEKARDWAKVQEARKLAGVA